MSWEFGSVPTAHLYTGSFYRKHPSPGRRARSEVSRTSHTMQAGPLRRAMEPALGIGCRNGRDVGSGPASPQTSGRGQREPMVHRARVGGATLGPGLWALGASSKALASASSPESSEHGLSRGPLSL